MVLAKPMQIVNCLKSAVKKEACLHEAINVPFVIRSWQPGQSFEHARGLLQRCNIADRPRPPSEADTEVEVSCCDRETHAVKTQKLFMLFTDGVKGLE